MPAQGRDRGSERRPEPSKGASRDLRTPLNRPSRGETTRFRAIPVADGPRIRPQRPPDRLHTPIPRRIRLPPPRPGSLRSPRRGGGRPPSPRCRPTHARHPAHPATPLPLAPLPRNRHRPRARSVATPRSHLDCRNVLILIVAGHLEKAEHFGPEPVPAGTQEVRQRGVVGPLTGTASRGAHPAEIGETRFHRGDQLIVGVRSSCLPESRIHIGSSSQMIGLAWAPTPSMIS